jgi:hypothetical protein
MMSSDLARHMSNRSKRVDKRSKRDETRIKKRDLNRLLDRLLPRVCLCSGSARAALRRVLGSLPLVCWAVWAASIRRSTAAATVGSKSPNPCTPRCKYIALTMSGHKGQSKTSQRQTRSTASSRPLLDVPLQVHMSRVSFHGPRVETGGKGNARAPLDKRKVSPVSARQRQVNAEDIEGPSRCVCVL